MEKSQNKNVCDKKKVMLYADGKIFFTKETERKFYFVLTLIMLLYGILSKADLF